MAGSALCENMEDDSGARRSSPMVLSLFPGIGLLDRAFESEGFCVVRGPDLLWGGDIHTFHPPANKFDGVIGGPPCQEFSPLRHLLATQGRKPRHGNLIPEFERVVAEARPAWFLMENVPQAPVPVVLGYISTGLILNNRWVGGVQHRKRRFSFGTVEGLELRFDGDLVVFEAGEWEYAIGSDPRPLHVTDGGSRRINRQSVLAGHGPIPGQRRPSSVIRSGVDNTPKSKGRIPAAVTSSDGGPSVRMARYTLAEMCVLQGLPANFCDEMPFTAEGKRRVIGNGVPLPWGRAIARAVEQALARHVPSL